MTAIKFTASVIATSLSLAAYLEKSRACYKLKPVGHTERSVDVVERLDGTDESGYDQAALGVYKAPIGSLSLWTL